MSKITISTSASARADEAIERLGITDAAEKAYIHMHELLHDIMHRPFVAPAEEDS